MSSKAAKVSRDERKKKLVRVVALVACAALLLTAIVPVFASGLFY